MVDGYIRETRKEKKKELIKPSDTKVIVNFYSELTKGLT